MEARPVKEHQSNSVAERAVQTVGGMVRTHRACKGTVLWYAMFLDGVYLGQRLGTNEMYIGTKTVSSGPQRSSATPSKSVQAGSS